MDVHGFDNRTMGVSVGLCWAVRHISKSPESQAALHGPAECLTCEKLQLKTSGPSDSVLVNHDLPTIHYSRDVFLFASSCYPLAKPSGETLKLLAVSVPSKKEQKNQRKQTHHFQPMIPLSVTFSTGPPFFGFR